MATRLTLILFIQCYSCTKLPVIVMNTTGTLCFPTSVNPFKDTPSENFTRFVLNSIRKSDNIIVFVEEQFSVEDVSSRDSLGSPFTNIRELLLKEQAQYMPRVNNPFRTLEKLLPPKETHVVHLKDNELRILNKNIKYHFVHFTEPEYFSPETRIQRLRRHDAYIKQMYNSLTFQRSGLVLVFYTGKTNPMLDVKPYDQPRKPKETKPHMVVTNQALVWLSGVVKQDGPKKQPLEEARASSRSSAQLRASTRVSYEDDLEIEFEFKYLSESWLLESVILLEGGEEVGRTRMGVGAPYGMSYFCSEPLIIGNTRDKSYVSIAKYQVEPQPQSHLENLNLGEDYTDFDVDLRANQKPKPTEEVIARARQKIARALADHNIAKTPEIAEQLLKYVLSKNNYNVDSFAEDNEAREVPKVEDDNASQDDASTVNQAIKVTKTSAPAATDNLIIFKFRQAVTCCMRNFFYAMIAWYFQHISN